MDMNTEQPAKGGMMCVHASVALLAIP